MRRDSTFLLNNRFFEAPPHLAGKRIEVRFDPLDLTQLEIYSRRQAGGRGAPGGCGRQRAAAALGNGGEVTMWESFFGFKKTPFSDSPDAKQLFASQAWKQVKTRLEFLAQHHGVGLLTGEVGAGKSTAARVFTAALNHQPVQDSLCPLLLRLGAGPAAPDRAGTGSGAGALSRRPGAPDRRRRRASEPEQEAASHSDLR